MAQHVCDLTTGGFHLGAVRARGSNDPAKGFISSGSEQYQGMILAGACQFP